MTSIHRRVETWAGATPDRLCFPSFLDPSIQPAPLAGNESAYEPNGAECYSCVGLSREACQGTAPPVVSCYNASDRVYKGCFDGNVTLSAGEQAPSCGSLSEASWVVGIPSPKGVPPSSASWELQT